VTVVWPRALRRLREQADDWTRKLRQLEEAAALDGSQIDWTVFPAFRGWLQGWADAYAEVFAIIAEEAGRQTTTPWLDLAVVELAQQGLEPDEIANRCGISERQVAEALARFAQAAAAIDDDTKGGKELGPAQ
jgi:hypothetical protein